MDAARSMCAVKSSLGYSLTERYREPEGAQWGIHQTFPVWPITHISREREVAGQVIIPVRLIEMLDCKT